MNIEDLKIAHIGWLSSSHLERRTFELGARNIDTVIFTDFIPSHHEQGDSSVVIEKFPSELLQKPFELLSWLENRIKVHDVHLLHIHSTHFPASLGFFIQSVPRLTSIWDFVYSIDPVSPLYHKVILEELHKRRLTDYISFSSKPVMDKWCDRGFPGEMAFWHSWGVDLNMFSPEIDSEDIKKLRHELGIGDHSRIIFSPRTPSLQANPDLLLQALPLLKASDEVFCVITGHCIPQETRYLEEFLACEKIAQKVRFVDPIHDINRLNMFYRLADVVVSLHSNDHNPATVLEAMAAGNLVVINESKTVEYWIKDGKNGFVVRTRDLSDLVNKLDAALSLPSLLMESWKRKNREKIESEANFKKTIDQLIIDYLSISETDLNPDKSLSFFHKGLLHDICGLKKKALNYYEKALFSKEKRYLLNDLIQEKKDQLARHDGESSFHYKRSEPTILKLLDLPHSKWEEELFGLSYSAHLYRHDIIAGFYPLLINGKFADIHYLIFLLGSRFSTSSLSWLSECINWFGDHWSLWEECGELLLLTLDGGSSLGIQALKTAKALGPNHRNYTTLLEKACAWTEKSIKNISRDLDERFRFNVNRQSSELLTERRIAVQ